MTAHVLLGLLRQLKVCHRAHHAFRTACMHRSKTRTHSRRDGEAGVAHSQWGKNALLHYLAQALAAYRFNDFADPVDVAAVLPRCSGVMQQHRAHGSQTGTDHAGDIFSNAIFHQVMVEKVIAETRCVQQQLADGDVRFGWPDFGFAVRIKALQHHDVGNFGHVSFGRIVQADLPLFNELHHSDTRDGFGA